MNFDDLLFWIKGTPISEAISESDWLFPAIESLHVIALTLVVGSIAVVDLRLLNLASKGRSPRDLIAVVIPITWGAFAVAALTGLCLFIAKPVTYGHNIFFLIKLALIGLAGANMLVFQLLLHPRLPSGEVDAPSPLARASGLTSLLLWTGVVVCGRWIGFSI